MRVALRGRLLGGLLGCLVVCSSASGDVPSEPPVVDTKTKLAGNVLVWADAVLQVESESATPAVRLARMRSRMFQLGSVFPAKVVGNAGELVELELIRQPNCAWNTAGRSSELAHIRVFVKRADLAPVVKRRFTKTFKDGSRITLEPGVPVVPDEHGYRISIDGDEVVVPIPASHIGHAYAPVKAKAVAKKKLHYWLAVNTVGRVGDFDLHVTNADTTAATVTKHKDRTLFPIRAACIDALVSVAADAVTDTELKDGDVPSDVYGGLVGVPDRWLILAGTPLRLRGSRTKRPVATTSAEVEVPQTFGYGRPKEVCVGFELGLEPHAWRAPRLSMRDATERTIELCAPDDRLKHDAPSP
jgi:hypothetical protein